MSIERHHGMDELEKTPLAWFNNVLVPAILYRARRALWEIEPYDSMLGRLLIVRNKSAWICDSRWTDEKIDTSSYSLAFGCGPRDCPCTSWFYFRFSDSNDYATEKQAVFSFKQVGKKWDAFMYEFNQHQAKMDVCQLKCLADIPLDGIESLKESIENRLPTESLMLGNAIVLAEKETLEEVLIEKDLSMGLRNIV